MLFVILLLDRTATFRFAYGALHGGGYGVGVHYDSAVFVSCRSAYRLNKSRLGSEQTFFIGIENGYERNLRKVKSFAQKIYSDKHVVNAETKIAQKLLTFHCFDFMMNVPNLYKVHFKIFAKIFCHFLCKRCDKHPFALLGAFFYLAHKVVHLSFYGTDFNLRIEQSRRADYLLDKLCAVFFFVRTGRCTDVYHLI